MMHKGVEINQLNGFTEILEAIKSIYATKMRKPTVDEVEAQYKAIKSIYATKMRKPTVDEVEAQYKADRDDIKVILDGWWRELTNG